MSTKTPEKEGFINVTGGKVWYKIVGENKGTPLVVLHGGPGHPHDSFKPLEELGTDREIIFYDQLGCGNSDRPNDNKLWTVERFVAELEQVIKSLKLSKYHIFGHSWGSGLGASFALTNPQGLESVIFTGSFLSTPLWEKDAVRLINKLPIIVRARLKKYNDPEYVKTKEFEQASEEYYKNFVHRWKRTPAPHLLARKKFGKTVYNFMWGPKEFAATGTLKHFDLTKRLHEIAIPVLLICGRFDESTPETNQYYKKLFPNAKLKILKNSAHMSYWTDTKEFLKTAREFLKKVDEKTYEN